MSEKSTRTYLDVFKHILSDGESVFPFSRADNAYDLSKLSEVKFKAGGVEHPVSNLKLIAKEGPAQRWIQSWVKKAAVRAALRKAGVRAFTADSANGVVTADAAFNNVTFEAPAGRFESESLLTMTLAGALQSIAATLEENPLSEWDDFAHWLGVGRADFINQISSQFDAVEVNGTEYPIPNSAGFSDFSGFARWIITLLGDSAQLPASTFWDAEQTKFVVPVTLKQKPVTVRRMNAAMVDEAIANLFVQADASAIFFERRDGQEYGIVYLDINGLLDKRVLIMHSIFCPTFEASYGADSDYSAQGYNLIVYLYETTTVTSLGVSLPAGWYVCNMSTMAVQPFSLADNPIVIAAASFLENDATAFSPSFRDMFTVEGTGSEKVFRFSTPVIPDQFVDYSANLRFRLQTEKENYFITANSPLYNTFVMPMAMSRKGYARFGSEWTHIAYVCDTVTYNERVFQPGWYKCRFNKGTGYITDIFDVESCPVELDPELLDQAKSFVLKRPITASSAMVSDPGRSRGVTFTFDL